ncbi:hypothetical protein ACFYXM_15380 [Streptomyces sp. NPDC002476]|uniref:hypothetical protein n=1 Tax=Streptomyces sp. NPDC002476 TaxID=3364648 RepID=UPI0036CAAF3A
MDRDAKGRSHPPGPDPRYRVVGVAHLPAGTAARAVADPSHAFEPSAPHGVPDVPAPFLSAYARGMTSASCDALPLGSGAVDDLPEGRFFRETATDSLPLDTVTPG